MRVDKIELIGFKSFCDRTAFSLHPGITCIVGPNGCGKSNVVDAFRWVLGEQSAKSLRGDRMEEVIFAGSQTKKPRGMSEVTLSVSGLGGNGSDTLTSVSRRLYRSGDSDYLLNRSSCRLKDIRDIFLDTGLEIKSYSILEQDRIAAILSARPDERRFIIEEVAGVVKYKVRRNEARSKLESSHNNLQRISDIISEVRRQINSLDRQVRKAERYKRLMEDLKAIELKVAKRDHSAMQGELEEILRDYERTREEDSLRRAEFGRIEAELESERIGIVEKEKAIEALQAELQSVEREMADMERSLALLLKEREHLRESVRKLTQEEADTANKLRESENRRLEIGRMKNEISGTLSALGSEAEQKAEVLRSFKAELEEKEGLLETGRRDSFRASEELVSLKNELGRLEAALENLSRRAQSINRESGELLENMEQSRATGRELDSSMLARNNDLMLLKQEKEQTAAEIDRLREQMTSQRASLARAREELASASSRMDSLGEMVHAETSGEELSRDVEILASIADIIEVPAEYERAVESALREAVSGFVLRTTEDIKRGVSALNAKDTGRTALVPLEAGSPLPEAPALNGVMAMAAEVVNSPEHMRGVVQRLLGNVALVRDLDAALDVKGPGLTFVTLDGVVVETSGAVFAGRSKGIITLKRQLRELGEDIETRKSKLESMEKDAQGTGAALEEMEKALASLGEREVVTERELSLIRLKAEKNSEEAERTGRKLSLLKIELDEVRREEESLRSEAEARRGEITRREEARATSERAMAELAEEISEARQLFEERRSESVELRLSLNSLKEKSASLEADEQSIIRLINELSDKKSMLIKEARDAESRIRTGEEEARVKEEALKSHALRASELSAIISQKKDVVTGESDGIHESERELKSLRLGIDDSTHRLSELEVRRAESKLKIENLDSSIKNSYGVGLDDVEAGEVTVEEEERLPEIKGRIESLGPVSLGSIEEYEELKGRYAFLTEQKEDLEKSIAELEEAISRINSTTRKKLREAYEALRTKFSEVFITLFGGGRAELVLTDEKNILETGMDIIAQPPGKKLQNISLLSGGEKSLTALALLFASFLIKPTPLCILDEADAALDESNTHKFSEMLRELSRDTQFIVVTHNRVTMEAADFIYGITMEEPGNSKVISLEMAKA